MLTTEQDEPERQVQATSSQITHNTTTPDNAFPSYGVVSLFNYLTTPSGHIDWCRAIMRIFLRKSRDYRYQLTAQEIQEAMHETYAPTYTLEDCRGDLDRLVGWGNITTLHDSSRVTSIADFRSPILRYQATSAALEIETFLAEHTRVGSSEGGLYLGDLPRLWEALEQLHAWLQEGTGALTPERRLEIVEQWHYAFTTWEKVTGDAAQYLGSMHHSSQQAVNRDSYLIYKNAVVTYINNFGQALTYHSEQISNRLEHWRQNSLRTTLLEILESSPPPVQSLAEDATMQRRWSEDVQRQLEALEYWFANDHNSDLFRKAARDAIAKVVYRAHALSITMRPQTDYVTQLQELGRTMLSLDDLERAQQIFAAAFANTLPLHEPEGMAGSPSAADQPGTRPTWNAPPTVTRALRPIYKGSSERSVEPVMRSQAQDLAQLRAHYEKTQRVHRDRIEALFPTSLLDIGKINGITLEERMVLTELIDGCLNSPDHEYQASDGSIIQLLNEHEQQYTQVQANDGTLILPRYRLQRQLRNEQRQYQKTSS